MIDLANGGSIQGEIDALNRLIELAVPPTPFIYKGVGTYVIPGHGRICEQQDVVASFTERRKANGDDVEPVEKVLPETSRGLNRKPVRPSSTTSGWPSR